MPDLEERFVREHAALARVSFVPELELLLATEVTPLWLATEAWLAARDVPPPFWAFAWAGGQALARYLLDHPHLVRGKRVLDVATGSGLVALAAARAGAASVIAVDVDRFATAACALNARANDATLEVRCGDATREEPSGVDVVTAGDVWYDAGIARRFEPWLAACAGAGCLVLTGDPGRAYVPTAGVVERARYDIPTTIDLEGTAFKTARVLEIEPHA